MHQFVHVIIGNEAVDGSIHYPNGVHGYTYLNHVEDTEVGDVVIICLPRSNPKKPKFRFAKVVEAHSDEERGKAANKWIVDRIDWDKFNALQQLAPPESFDASGK